MLQSLYRYSQTSYCEVSYHDVQGLMLGKTVVCARLCKNSHGMAVEITVFWNMTP